MPESTDHLIVGAGVVGLALAFELASRGQTVRVVERGISGKQSSWAATGILPAVPEEGVGRDAFQELNFRSGRMFGAWLDRIRSHTDSDPEFERSGGLHLASGPAEAAALAGERLEWDEQGLEFETLTPQTLVAQEPALQHAIEQGHLKAAFRLPGESMIRTPRYLKALVQACRHVGVMIEEQVEIHHWKFLGNRIDSVHSAKEAYTARQFCLTTGVWSAAVATDLGLRLDIRPWRGQILMLCPPASRNHPDGRIIGQVLNDGPRYLVPRKDGRVLVGSTVEDVGFDLQTTESAMEDLRQFAGNWIPALKDAPSDAQWAGLRPGTGDNWPYLGRARHAENGFVASGHFRSGVFLSPITAKIMTQLMLGEPPDVELSDFRLDRKQ